ncbi:MAG TPA: SRPBCC domain-containing protein [Gemmatimonadales bacterium]|jgi:carbon monoxide dehydrogenase subunit G
MRLSFTGANEVAASLADVWLRIVDPHFVGRNGPGVESVEVLDPRHFKVICGLGVGSIRVRFGIDVELAEVNPPNYFSMKARGQAPGSRVEVTATMALETMAATRTRLNWKAETEISGTVASIGARLMEGTARRLTDLFWTRFAASIAAAAPTPPAEAEPPSYRATEPPSDPAAEPPAPPAA